MAEQPLSAESLEMLALMRRRAHQLVAQTEGLPLHQRVARIEADAQQLADQVGEISPDMAELTGVVLLQFAREVLPQGWH